MLALPIGLLIITATVVTASARGNYYDDRSNLCENASDTMGCLLDAVQRIDHRLNTLRIKVYQVEKRVSSAIDLYPQLFGQKRRCIHLGDEGCPNVQLPGSGKDDDFLTGGGNPGKRNGNY